MHAPTSPFETPPFGRLLILKASVASASKDEEVSPLSYAIAPLRERDGVCGGGGCADELNAQLQHCLISATGRARITAMRWLILSGVLLVAATGATYAGYGSLSPCRWLVVDTAAHTGLPDSVAAARARADMALHGDLDPNGADCLRAWWRVRFASAKNGDS